MLDNLFGKPSKKAVEKLYYTHSTEEDAPHFRSGTATITSPDMNKSYDAGWEEELPISVNLYSALIGMGIVEKLQHLPMHFGPIDAYEEAILLPSGLAEAATILEAEAKKIGAEKYDLYLGELTAPRVAELRIVIDNDCLEKELKELALFFRKAAQINYAVQLWL